ncbi:hypothetical protein K461DRAFT_221718 [Myriangium duriaei CBS 260.36]|uniref:L-lactate dehydrogenase (cytochrome) n=1 Tax=Myriangium duriaei CBS 260.36 TaxID=1168546 RepID=A0A9P4J599_9PEZI|nr:hypothetical protein K461DRAFT_221718 [Myriangium duriaei CBS 260.36]
MADKKVTVDEISKHGSPDDCWIVVDGAVWDLSQFAPDHPGGAHVITRHAGRDASESYNSIHDPALLSETLPQSAYKGQLDTSTITDDWAKPPPTTTPELKLGDKPPLSTVLNAQDFESIAERTVSPKTWAFYSSAATDCVTRAHNNSFFSRIYFRPRILRNVSVVSTSTTMLDAPLDLPLYVAPAALAKLIHPDGETAIARGCVATRVAQVISTNASLPLDKIVSSSPSTPFFFQLYVNSARHKTEKLLATIQSSTPITALFVTVDAPVPGKREADERLAADASLSSPMSGATATNDAKGGGLGRVMGSYIDASLSWADIPWLRRHWRGKIVLKGIQTSADAVRAARAGVDGIVVSNHGGRSLDTAPPAVLVLLELRVRCPWIFTRMEVFLDSGVRRGSDVVKCLCLGARAVGMGRSVLWAANYGAEGVEKLVEIVRDEVEVTMKMLGVTRIEELHPGLLNWRDLEGLVPEREGWWRRWARL